MTLTHLTQFSVYTHTLTDIALFYERKFQNTRYYRAKGKGHFTASTFSKRKGSRSTDSSKNESAARMNTASTRFSRLDNSEEDDSDGEL